MRAWEEPGVRVLVIRVYGGLLGLWAQGLSASEKHQKPRVVNAGRPACSQRAGRPSTPYPIFELLASRVTALFRGCGSGE